MMLASLQSSLYMETRETRFVTFLIKIVFIYFSFSLYVMAAALRFFYVMRKSAVNYRWIYSGGKKVSFYCNSSVIQV